MNVVFYNRDFSGQLQPAVTITAERYSHNMIGGPKRAYLRAKKDERAWELVDLLRCPVEIWGGDGKLVWWGYVNRVVIPFGSNMIGVGLDAMANYVVAAWTSSGGDSGTTTAVQDVVSVREYGRKEARLRLQNTGETLATQRASMELAEHKYHHPEIEKSGGRDYIQIECLGWYNTLDWRYYSNGTSANVENTTQIEAIVTACGEFFKGCRIESIANQNSDQERDGDATALTCVDALLGAGTSNFRPLLAEVVASRYLRVYERTAEPKPGAADYMLRDDGNLETPLGSLVPAAWCTAAAWVEVKDAPDMLLGLSAMRPFFIEEAEYNALTDRCTYSPAGGYEQERLRRFVHHNGKPSDGIAPGEDTGNGILIPPPSTDSSTDTYGYYNYYGNAWGGSVPSPAETTVTSGVTITGSLNSVGTNATIQFTPSAGLYEIGVTLWFPVGFYAYNPFVLILDVALASYEYAHIVAGGIVQDATDVGSEVICWTGVHNFSGNTTMNFKCTLTATNLVGGIGTSCAQIYMRKIQ